MNEAAYGPGIVGLKLRYIWQELPGVPVAVSVPHVLNERENGDPDGVIAVVPVMVTVDVDPFPIVTVGLEPPLIDVETLRGFGDATTALLPVPLTAMLNGLLAEFAPV